MTDAEVVALIVDGMKATGRAAAQHAVDTVRWPAKIPAVVVVVLGKGTNNVATATVLCVASTNNIDVVVPANITITVGQSVLVEFRDGVATVVATIA